MSPHLDDAVLSCSALIAARPGAVVVTVFAGAPDAEAAATDWDRRCGFAEGASAQRARRREDRAALAVVGARPLWLDFLDHQYGQPSPLDAIVAALDHVLPAGADVAGPVGIHHPDHEQVGAAVRRVHAQRRRETGAAIVFADSPYRAIDSGRPLVSTLSTWRPSSARQEARFEASPALATLKARALAHYESQLPALRSCADLDMNDCTRPEQYWTAIGP